MSAHLPHKGKKLVGIRGSFDGNPGIREWETQTTSDLGWRLQYEPVRYDRLFPCGRVDSKTKNAGGHERLTESESITHDGDRTGLDGDEHVDERRHRTRGFHKIQLVKSRRFADTNGIHHDFEKIGNETCADTGLRLVQDGSQSDCKARKPVLTNFFQELYSIPTNQEEATQSERRHWVELWKNLRVDCAGGMLITPKKLENVLKKLKNEKGSLDQITADVLKALLSECLEKLARSLSLMCWDMTFPEDWLCFMTVMAPKVVGATCFTKFRPIAGLCAMRKVLGYGRLKSLLPLRYESVQTAFVPKTHADVCLFLLLKAAELSREWQREIVVVQRSTMWTIERPSRQ